MILTLVLTATGLVLTVKMAVVWPAGTVTLAGTWAAALLLDRVTMIPPVGAGPVSVTVPVDEFPPATGFGLRTMDDSLGSLITRPVLCVVPQKAVIVAVVLLVTGLVVTMKVAVVWPAGMVTEAGTWAAALSEESVTSAPPVGAGPLIVTVPVDGVPPITEVGLRLTELKTIAVTVKFALRVTPI